MIHSWILNPIQSLNPNPLVQQSRLKVAIPGNVFNSASSTPAYSHTQRTHSHTQSQTWALACSKGVTSVFELSAERYIMVGTWQSEESVPNSDKVDTKERKKRMYTHARMMCVNFANRVVTWISPPAAAVTTYTEKFVCGEILAWHAHLYEECVGSNASKDLARRCVYVCRYVYINICI